MNPYDFFASFYQEHYDHGLKDIFLELIFAHTIKTSTLEIGAGPGLISLALADAGYQVTATDISDNFLTMIQQSASDKSLQLNTELYDVLTPKDETYGLVIMVFDVINHLETLDQFATAIEHLERLTEPGGYYLFDIIKASYFEQLVGYQETFKTQDESLIWTVKQGTFKHSVRHQFQKAGQIQTLNQRTFDDKTLESLLKNHQRVKTVECEDRKIYLFQKK